MKRIDSADVFQDNDACWPSGYVLRLQPDGIWELLSTRYKKPVVALAAGIDVIKPEQWHHLELNFKDTPITIILDGKTLATVQNSTHVHGMFAVGSEWDHVQFDNLRVTHS
jgi:hypothetical protein